MTLGEDLKAAAEECARFSIHDTGPDATGARWRRNDLIRYAYQRGCTVRQLCDVTGISSTSTIARILRGIGDADRKAAVLADETPAVLR